MKFKVLGSVDVERDGTSVAVGGPQQRRLLGVLLVGRGRTVSSERLIEALWPDGDAPDGAARSVMTYVSRLRAALGDGHVATQGSGYRLRYEPASYDVDEFEALVTEAERSLPDQAIDCYDRALGLWEGEAFGAFASEWWALAESTRLAELKVAAQEERVAALMTIGHHGRAVPALEGLIVEHPLRERPVSLLMQALVATGRRAEALRAFRAYRSLLAEETGLEPSPELVRFERTIAADLEPSDNLSTGRPLRGYVIDGAVGEGAHGRVYLATQPGTERRVAIKAIRPDLADSSDFIRRFEAEARLVARLEHPHIVPLYDYWREPGGAYLVFRYLSGGTARDSVISGGPWSLRRVSQLVEEVGGALIAAHAVGVQHNDVKASNVMLDDRGGAYLTDFGIAVRAEEPAAVCAGVRGDVRGLGWLLWELLTGAGPRAGPTASSVLDRRAGQAAPSLVGEVSAVPEGLDAVFTKATSPDGGYDTVAELVLGWRAAVGRPDGVLSPVSSEERRAVDAARRAAAIGLTEATAAGVNPYKGLRPFDEADTAEFFGRDVVIDALEEAIRVRRLVTVVGASGSGKSSVVRAGLVPRLRAAGHTVITIVPGDDPLGALRETLLEVSTRRRRTADLAALIRHVHDAFGPIAVVLDQFEECWTRADPDRRAEFVDLVTGVIEGDLEVRFVATIRADAFDRPLQDPRVGSHVGAGAFVLGAMSPAQLGDAITLPAARAGVTVDEAVVAHLVTETAAQAGSLPLLQFTLAELYDRRVDGCIGVDALTAVGGMAGSIGRRAESVYASLDAQSQEDTRAVFSRLVTPGDGLPDARRRARLSELSPGARAVAGRYVESRLLVTDRDPASREPTLEVAHEALLARWTRLAGWIDEDRRWLAQLQHVAAAARAWDEGGRPPTELYRGSRLEAGIEALDAGRPMSETEREFVAAGRELRDRDVVQARRSARRLRRLLSGVAVALVLAIVAGAIALVQRHRANHARDNAVAAEIDAENARQETAAERDEARIDRLVAESERLLPSQLDLAGLLAVEARRRDDSPDTRGALLTALAHTMPTSAKATIPSRFLGYLQPAANVGDGGLVLDLSGDGSVVAAASWSSGGSQITAYDVRSHEVVAQAEAPLLVRGMDLSADGRTVVALIEHIGDDPPPDSLMILDVAAGTSTSFDIGPRTDGDTSASRLQLTSDAKQAIVLRHDGSLTAWDVATGSKSDRPLPDGPFDWFDVTGDGTLVTLGRPVDGRLTVSWFDLATGTAVRTEAVDTGGNDVGGGLDAVSPDGRTLAIAQWQGPLFLWDLTTGTPIPDAGGRPNSVRTVAFDPADPATLTVTTTTGELVFFDVAGNSAIGEPVRVHGNGMRGVAFDAEGRTMAALADDRRISLWGDNTSPGLVDSPYTDDPELGNAVFSPDGTHVLLFGAHAELRLVDDPTAPGTIVRPPEGSGDTGYYHARFDGDGSRLLLSATDIPDYVADAATGVAIWSVPDNVGLVRDISPDGTTVVIDRDGGVVTLWDIDANKQLASVKISDLGLEGLIQTFVTFSPDGKFVDAVTDFGAVRLSVPSLALVSFIDSRRAQCTVARVPGSDLLASMDGPGRVSLFDMAGGAIARTGVSRDSTSICGVGASPDGSLVAAYQSFTQRMALFDGASMRPIGAPMPVGAGNGWRTPAFSDATHMVDPGAAGGLALYDLDPDHWQVDVCQQAGRNLTGAEWDEYLGADEPYRTTCPQWPSGE